MGQFRWFRRVRGAITARKVAAAAVKFYGATANADRAEAVLNVPLDRNETTATDPFRRRIPVRSALHAAPSSILHPEHASVLPAWSLKVAP